MCEFQEGGSSMATQPLTFRHGSNERDSSSSIERSSPVMLSAAKHLSAASTERSSPVMLSAAKHLSADRDRPFAEFTLSETNVLRACPERSEGVTQCDCSNCQGLFFTIEPCLSVNKQASSEKKAGCRMQQTCNKSPLAKL